LKPSARDGNGAVVLPSTVSPDKKLNYAFAVRFFFLSQTKM